MQKPAVTQGYDPEIQRDDPEYWCIGAAALAGSPRTKVTIILGAAFTGSAEKTPTEFTLQELGAFIERRKAAGHDTTWLEEKKNEATEMGNSVTPKERESLLSHGSPFFPAR